MGPETVDLLDKLLVLNPRERLTAAQALDHDYFWTDPLPADPKTYVTAFLVQGSRLISLFSIECHPMKPLTSLINVDIVITSRCP